LNILKKLVLLCSLLLVTIHVSSQVKDTIIADVKSQIYTLPNGEMYTYKKPKFSDCITKVPKDFTGTLHDVTKKSNLIALGASTLATVVLIQSDQTILEHSRDLGEKIGLKSEALYNNFGPLSNIPPNVTSGIYLIGNGTTPILLSMGFATYGLIKNDYRSLNTASGLIESLAVSGIFSQTVKRISGRQSPAPALMDGNPGGDWNPFPSFSAFAKNTPNYDAFPSGHMMTATSALYVIMGNYPEVKWIRPVGYTLIGVLGFEMVQANVHWASDYPIAMVMGYIIGKNIANSKMTKSKQNLTDKKYKINYNASRAYGYNMIGAKLTF
jgi:hypothetical protein